MLTHLQSWAHTLAPAGGATFEIVTFASLACYLIFAVVALHYALRPWAEAVMGASLTGGTLASLVLHLSLRHTPSYMDEGPVWKFVSLSQYLPYGVISLCCLYLLYRLGRIGWKHRQRRKP